MQGLVLHQANEELQLGSCSASSYWGITVCQVLLCLKLLESITICWVLLLRQASECNVGRFCFASRYWGITICRVLFCINQLGGLHGAENCTLHFDFRLLSCVELMRNYKLWVLFCI